VSATGKLVVVVFGAAMLAPLTSAVAATTKVTVENLRGPLINAWFSAPDPSDPSGCRVLDAFVTANSGLSQQLPDSTAVGIAAVNVDAYDSCTGQTLFQAVGQIDTTQAPGAAFVVSKQYDLATLKATIPVTDIDTGATSNVTLDVTLRGTSDLYRSHENTNDIYTRDCHVLNRWKGTGRDAVATGTVSDGGTNYTPAPSQNAEIGMVVDGFEVIGCS
jgi:hypothetical protein